MMNTAHVEAKGHCWEFQSANLAKFDHFKSETKAHGCEMKDGACTHGKKLEQYSHEGITITEFGAGASQPYPFMDLGENIHMNLALGGVKYCMQMSGKAIENQAIRSAID